MSMTAMTAAMKEQPALIIPLMTQSLSSLLSPGNTSWLIRLSHSLRLGKQTESGDAESVCGATSGDAESVCGGVRKVFL